MSGVGFAASIFEGFGGALRGGADLCVFGGTLAERMITFSIFATLSEPSIFKDMPPRIKATSTASGVPTRLIVTSTSLPVCPIIISDTCCTFSPST